MVGTLLYHSGGTSKDNSKQGSMARPSGSNCHPVCEKKEVAWTQAVANGLVGSLERERFEGWDTEVLAAALGRIGVSGHGAGRSLVTC